MKKKKFVSAIIVAAGSAVRMNRDKMLLPLCKIPCIARTMLAFEKSEMTDEIVVVTRPEMKNEIEKLAKEYKISKLSAIVDGGKSRQESAANGFYKINEKSETVCVHDGARPLIKPETIDFLLNEAENYPAICAGKPVTDTIKRLDENGFILETPQRNMLAAAVTPQIFSREVYTKAVENARGSFERFTDDSGMAEACGIKVKLCDCGPSNIKITTPEDVFAAEKIILSQTEKNNEQDQ